MQIAAAGFLSCCMLFLLSCQSTDVRAIMIRINVHDAVSFTDRTTATANKCFCLPLFMYFLLLNLSDVVLEIKVLVLWHLEDKKYSEGLALQKSLENFKTVNYSR